MSLNKAMLIGNLGRDAELRYTQGGTPVATLNLATTEVWRDKNGDKKEQTEWHRVVVWGKTAESLAEYLKKGKQIYVEGRIQTRKWTDKDGHDRWSTEINAQQVRLLGQKGGGRREEPPDPDDSAADGGRATAAAPLNDDDIPF